MYTVPEYFPTTIGHTTADAYVSGGPVSCYALLRLTMSTHGGVLQLHQGAGVTDIECLVNNGYQSFTKLGKASKKKTTNSGFWLALSGIGVLREFRCPSPLKKFSFIAFN